jgi:deazaflavin-dependent oxidoreductase (nitroreductase family)
MTETIDFDELNPRVIEEFRAKGGKVGGMFEGAPLLLLHHTGAKSGLARITPLGPYLADGRIYVFATKAGAPENPAWFHNLVANPKTTVELGTETFAVVARVLTGARRDEIFARQAAMVPQLSEYQSRTARVIPVIELVRDPA